MIIAIGVLILVDVFLISSYWIKGMGYKKHKINKRVVSQEVIEKLKV